MSRQRRRWAVGVVALATLALQAQPSSAIAVDPLQDLGTLGGLSSSAAGINGRGEVVGTSSTLNGPEFGFVTDPSGTMRSIGTLCPGVSPICTPRSWAYAINDAGQVAGASTGLFFEYPLSVRAIRYDAATDTMEELGTLGGETSLGYAIDANGVVVGSADTGILDAPSHAFAAAPGSAMVDLGTLVDPLPAYSQANDINAHGIVVGSSNFSADPNLSHPVTWDLATGQITDLGTLGNVQGIAEAISERGFITGSLSSPAGTVPFVYDPSTAAMRALPLPPGMWTASGDDVNDDGVVLIVGTSQPSPGVYERHTFVFDSRTDDLTEIMPLAGANVMPGAISDDGVVVGGSSYDETTYGLEHAFRTRIEVAPAAPTALDATGCGPTATLSWSAPPFAGYADALRYEVRRDGVAVATVDTTTFTDPAAPARATYEVLAVNDGGASSLSSVGWQPPACPTTTTTSATPTSVPTSLPRSPVATAVVSQPHLTG